MCVCVLVFLEQDAIFRCAYHINWIWGILSINSMMHNMTWDFPAMSLHPHCPHWLLGWFHILGWRISLRKFTASRLPLWHLWGKDIQHQTFPKLSTTSPDVPFPSLFPSTVWKKNPQIHQTNCLGIFPGRNSESHCLNLCCFPQRRRRQEA